MALSRRPGDVVGLGLGCRRSSSSLSCLGEHSKREKQRERERGERGGRGSTAAEGLGRRRAKWRQADGAGSTPSCAAMAASAQVAATAASGR
jgi:hypothetical protein